MRKLTIEPRLMKHESVPADSTSIININHIHVPVRKEFLTINELSQQIPFGRSKILEMVQNGDLKEEIHYRIIGRKYVFYFPAVIGFFKPKLADG